MVVPIRFLIIALVLSEAAWAWGAPTGITLSDYTVADGQSIVISGTGFGTKSSAAPVKWDDCSGSDPSTLWESYGTQGMTCGGSCTGDNLDYRTVIRGVAMPHSHITQYLAGSHAESGTGLGLNVYVFDGMTAPSYPFYLYVSYYIRYDPNWSFSDTDSRNNHKWLCWGNSSVNRYGTSYWYLECKAHGEDTDYIAATTDTGKYFQMDDSGGTLFIWPDGNGHSRYATNLDIIDLPWNGWVKREVEICITDQTTGFIRAWDNGTKRYEYLGPTDNTAIMGADGRGLMIEGFSQNSGNPGNYRYMADIYLDYSLQRVLIGNANTLAGCTTLREVQIPSAWSDTEITVTVNQGGFSDDATAYLYVVDASGAANSAGIEVTFGDSPAPPTLSNVTISGGSFR